MTAAHLIGASVVLVLRHVEDARLTTSIAIRFAEAAMPDGSPGYAAQIVCGQGVVDLDAARVRFVLDGLNQLAGVLAAPRAEPGTPS